MLSNLVRIFKYDEKFKMERHKVNRYYMLKKKFAKPYWFYDLNYFKFLKTTVKIRFYSNIDLFSA